MGWHGSALRCSARSRTAPLMLPSPVHASQPGPDVYPGAPSLALLTPSAMSWNTALPAKGYSRGLGYPGGLASVALSTATSPAYIGATALVPPTGVVMPSKVIV